MSKKKNKKPNKNDEEIIEQSELESVDENVSEPESELDEIETVPSDEDADEDAQAEAESLLEQNNLEPVDENVSEPESELDEVEAVPSDEDVQIEAESPVEQTDETGDDSESTDDDISSDDLLDDVRRSLIEEDVQVEKEKKPKWWQKIGIGAKKDKTPEEVAEVAIPVVEIEDVLDAAEVESMVEQTEEEEADESIDELIGILGAEEEEYLTDESVVDEVEVAAEEEEPVAEVEKVDVEELKKRAFQSSKDEDQEESFSDVRAVALEDGEEIFVEVEVKAEDPAEERRKAFENALRPYRRYIYFGIAFIGIVAIIATSALFYDLYQRSLPPTPTPVVSNLPYPVNLNIPGLPSIILSRGQLDDGRWDPRRPEWLEGTEVCRWIALPYSQQLEAVIRTLTQDDQLEIVMSNSDEWSYNVYSITQMTLEDMQEVSENSSCLLLVLADADTDTRWVVTAYP